jgi:hypothetical protein
MSDDMPSAPRETAPPGPRWTFSAEFHRRIREGAFPRSMASVYMDLVLLRQRRCCDTATADELSDGGRIWPQTVRACLSHLAAVGYVRLRDDDVIEVLDLDLLVAPDEDGDYPGGCCG